MTAGVSTGTWKYTVIHTKPSTIRTVSFMWVMGHIRTRLIARGGMWRHSSIPTTGWLTTSPGPLHVCGGVLIRQRRPLNLLHVYRCKHWLERVTCPQHWSCATSLAVFPFITSSVLLPTTGRGVAHNVPWITWGFYSWCSARHTPLQLWITVPRSEGVSFLTLRVSIRNYYTYHWKSQNLPPPPFWGF